MKKQLICAFLSAALCLSFTACSSRNTPVATEPAQAPTVQTAAEPSAAAETQAPVNPETKPAEATQQHTHEAVPLTAEEAAVLEAIGEDIHVVADDAYIETLVEMNYHAPEFAGRIYQIEGVLVRDEQSVYLARTLVHGDETANLGIELKYLEKELADGAWVRATGTVAQAEGGHAVLELIAIEALSQCGQEQMEWDGNDPHHH